jgi:hypothetical protein
MKCPECGSNTNDNDKFCNSCGAEIPAQESQDPTVDDNAAPAETEPVSEELQEPADHAVLESEQLLDETEPALEATETAPPDSEPDAPPPPVTKVKGRTNTGLIIGLVVLVVLLACCCCAIVGGIVFFEPLSDAINNASMSW